MTVYVVWADCGKWEGYSWMVKGFTDRGKAEAFAVGAYEWLKERDLLYPEPPETEQDNPEWWKKHQEFREYANVMARQKILELNPFDPGHVLDLESTQLIEYSVRELEVGEA